jgi:hypothetical protein
MIGKFAQNNKVINCLPPAADRFATAGNGDVIRADNCDSIVFLVMTGASADNTNVITVESCDNVTPTTSTAIVFTVSSVVSGDTNDTPTATATTGKAFTASTADQYYIVEVDPADVAAANSEAGDKYVRCVVTEAGTATAQLGCIVGIRVGEHIAQAVLPTKIV